MQGSWSHVPLLLSPCFPPSFPFPLFPVLLSFSLNCPGTFFIYFILKSELLCALVVVPGEGGRPASRSAVGPGAGSPGGDTVVLGDISGGEALAAHVHLFFLGHACTSAV